MNNPRIINTLISSIFLALALIHPVYASTEDGTSSEKHCNRGRQAMHGNKESHHGGLPPFLKDIALSSTQKEQITAIIQGQESNMKTHREQRHTLMKEMFTITNNETFDENQATLIADKVAILEKNVFLNRAKTGNKIFSLLTPEQRKQVTENMHDIEAKPANFKRDKQKLHDRVKG